MECKGLNFTRKIITHLKILIILFFSSIINCYTEPHAMTDLNKYKNIQIMSVENNHCPTCLSVTNNSLKTFSFVECNSNDSSQRFNITTTKFYATATIKGIKFKFNLSFKFDCGSNSSDNLCKTISKNNGNIDTTEVFVIIPIKFNHIDNSSKTAFSIITDKAKKCLTYNSNNTSNIQMNSLFDDCSAPFNDVTQLFYFVTNGNYMNGLYEVSLKLVNSSGNEITLTNYITDLTIKNISGNGKIVTQKINNNGDYKVVLTSGTFNYFPSYLKCNYFPLDVDFTIPQCQSPIKLKLSYLDIPNVTANTIVSSAANTCLKKASYLVNLRLVNKSTSAVYWVQHEYPVIKFGNTPLGTYDIYQECYHNNSGKIYSDYKLSCVSSENANVTIYIGTKNILSKTDFLYYSTSFVLNTFKDYLEYIKVYELSDLDGINMECFFVDSAFYGYDWQFAQPTAVGVALFNQCASCDSISDNCRLGNTYDDRVILSLCELDNLQDFGYYCNSDEVLRYWKFEYAFINSQSSLYITYKCCKANISMFYDYNFSETLSNVTNCVKWMGTPFFSAPAHGMVMNGMTLSYSFNSSNNSLTKLYKNRWAVLR